ncbi:MAG: hypothetical protein WC791_02670 [Candidatus Paceibacterota bacterium]|jgi:hypothetical protein
MSEDVKSKISELEKELYSKDFTAHRVEDILAPKQAAEVPVWSAEEEMPPKTFDEAAMIRRHNMMKKFVKFSIGFFVLAVAIAAFVWWRGANIVSGDNIAIDIVAPVAAAGGEPFDSKFTITNNNKVPIEVATLLIEYPTGFYSTPNKTDLPRVSKDFGVIAVGQSISETVNTLLYGEESTNKDVSVTLEYRMAGSNAILKKVTTYSIKVASSPVNIQLVTPRQASSGQEIEMDVDISSNSRDAISALVVNATYPSGFTFISANIAPSYDNNVWVLSNLAPQEKRTIKIIGIIEGQEGEDKVSKISVGTQSVNDERQIGIIYNATTESSNITKPFLALELAVNNNRAQNNVASINKGVRVDVFWKSNNDTKVTDAVIAVKLKGTALNKYSIYASSGGFYRSVDNTIVWDKTGNQDLSVLEPGANGMVTFSFSPTALGVGSGTLIKNPQIIFEVSASALQTGEASSLGKITTRATGSVKFDTEVKIAAKGLYFTGPFQSTGPLPPQADKETTYTVSLTAQNSANNVSSTYIKTTLPIYVDWKNNIYPEGEDITFNESTREIAWNVGRIPAGGTRDASFQISIIPSINHINTSPLLTGEFDMISIDDFTKSEIRDKKPALTTYISSDPQFTPNDANVVN